MTIPRLEEARRGSEAVKESNLGPPRQGRYVAYGNHAAHDTGGRFPSAIRPWTPRLHQAAGKRGAADVMSARALAPEGAAPTAGNDDESHAHANLTSPQCWQDGPAP